MKKIKNKIQQLLSLIPKDKLLHYFYGSILSFTLFAMFNYEAMLVLVLSFAITKELVDKKFGTSNILEHFVDILFTVLPAILLGLVI